MGDPDAFNFERMLRAFEGISYKHSGDAALPDAAGFLEAMHSMSMLFDHLGRGFSFVRTDIVDKTALLSDYYRESIAEQAEEGSLQDLVEREIASNTHRIGKPSRLARVKHRPSASRTLWRLLWAVKFLYLLLKEVAKEDMASSSDSLTGTSSMRTAVDFAYKEALYEHHGTALRKAVRVALAMLPTKESFLLAVGVEETKHDEYLKRIEVALYPVMNKGYNFYQSRQMTDLP